jgi:hypothetical protein
VIFILAIFVSFPGKEFIILGSLIWIVCVIRILGEKGSNLDLFFWYQARSDFASWIRVCIEVIPYPVEDQLLRMLWERVQALTEQEPASGQKTSWNASCEHFAHAVLQYIETTWSHCLPHDDREHIVRYLTLQIGLMYNKIIHPEPVSPETDHILNGS